MYDVFIRNINEYLQQRRIKHNYIALMTGWDKSKISRLLNGKAELKLSDMEVLAKALGHDVVFFLKEQFQIENVQKSGQIAFFAGDLHDDDKKTADKLVEMFRFYDSLASINL